MLMGEYSAKPLQPGEVLRIVPDQVLRANEWLVSPNGEYRMGLLDGRIVVQHKATGEIQWQQYNKDERLADKIIFETEAGDGAENRLELHDHKDKEIWSASVDNEATRGPAATGGWDDYDDGTDHVPAQYVLTNDGELLLVKTALPPDWKGDLTADNPNVLWFNQKVNPGNVARLRDADAKKAYLDGLDRDPKEGDKLSAFPLEIRVPPGSASAMLKSAIDLANSQLNYLAFQLGQKKKPDALQSPDKGKDTNPWDENLRIPDEDFQRLSLTAPKPGDSGESVDAYKSTETMLNNLAVRWNAMDDKFKIADQTLDLDNAQTYKRMYDTVQDAHEKIWAHLQVGVGEQKSGESHPTTLYAEFGIQDIAEEPKVYSIVRDTVDKCEKEVTGYSNRSAELAKEFGEFPGYPNDKGGGVNNAGNGGNAGNAGGNANAGNTGGNANAGNTGGNANAGNTGGNANAGNTDAYNGAPPPAQGTPVQQAASQSADDFSSTFDDLLKTTDAAGPTDGTQAPLGDDSGDTSSSPDLESVVRAALQNGAGTGSETGTNAGANTGSVAPAANAAGDNGMANAMQQMAMMSAMSGMMNQGNR
ncbi:hypothetical protein, partial [Nocardia gipuzkoensis]|uniref:hypothetical protein n=1 Tax=Nocardia gipuzkoensis TaxID=2749991 RepID=UPI0015EE9866